MSVDFPHYPGQTVKVRQLAQLRPGYTRTPEGAGWERSAKASASQLAAFAKAAGRKPTTPGGAKHSRQPGGAAAPPPKKHAPPRGEVEARGPSAAHARMAAEAAAETGGAAARAYASPAAGHAAGHDSATESDGVGRAAAAGRRGNGFDAFDGASHLPVPSATTNALRSATLRRSALLKLLIRRRRRGGGDSDDDDDDAALRAASAAFSAAVVGAFVRVHPPGSPLYAVRCVSSVTVAEAPYDVALTPAAFAHAAPLSHRTSHALRLAGDDEMGQHLYLITEVSDSPPSREEVEEALRAPGAPAAAALSRKAAAVADALAAAG